MSRRQFLLGSMATGVNAMIAGRAAAQDDIRIGLVQSLTGPFNTVGKAAVNGALLYMQQHGDTVAGRKIQLIVKDDASKPDTVTDEHLLQHMSGTASPSDFRRE